MTEKNGNTASRREFENGEGKSTSHLEKGSQEEGETL